MSATGQITSLNVYPVKSCGGISLDAVEITDRGFAFDREWMVIDSESRFLSQREEPRLALVQPRIGATSLELVAPAMPCLRIPLGTRPSAAGTLRTIKILRFVGPALDEGTAAAEWFSQFLGRPTSLVRWSSEVQRISDRTWTDGVEASNRFTDGFPIMVLSEASLESLNARRQPAPPLPMNRFRPNLVIRGVPAHAEDAYGQLRIGDIELRLVKPCVRCRIITTDQTTGVADLSDPLKILATYRQHPRLKGIVFGQNAIVARGVGESLNVGMSVSLEDVRPLDPLEQRER